MAAPNIVNVGSVYGKTDMVTLSTSAASLVTNAGSSGSVLKINSLYVSNFNAASIAANVYIDRSGTNYYLAAGATVPSYSTLTVIGKDTSIYLEEGDIIKVSSSTSSGQAICSYEIIS